ncbi:MAG: hypothetical protein ACT4OZ_17950, partial [Gemmatimonadota bacterium]
MFTPAAAQTILAGLTSPSASKPLLSALGFTEPLPLDREALSALGLGGFHETFHLARRAGGGPLRSLIVRCRPGSGVRDVLPRISGRLCSAVPQFSWLLVGLGAERREAAIATWEDHGTGPRHSSLVVEPANVRVSDAETLVALAAAGTGDDALVHHRWHEILGRLVLSARFYRALERAVVTLGEGAEGRAPG